MRNVVALVAMLCLGAGAPVRAQSARNDSLRIMFFDVGQGDAALVVTPNDEHILIDAGPDGTRILSLLAPYVPQILDLVVATHNHADHIGGLPDVFAKYQVREFLENGVPAFTRGYRRTVEAVERERGLSVREAGERTFSVGSVHFRVLPPAREDDSQNNNSIGLHLQFGKFSAVLPGDAEGDQLDWWLRWWPMADVSVVKASLHGSASGSTPKWMEALAPKVVVVSVGAANEYGYPAKDVLIGWQSQGAHVYRTDAVGTITISAARDGGFSVTTSSGAMPWVSRQGP